MNYDVQSLVDVPRLKLDDVVNPLLSKSEDESKRAGIKLVKDAAKFGLGVKDYLTLAVGSEGGMNGYERVLMAARLPVRDDFENGITLQMASNTFQTYPGTRAMFPEVIDDVLAWKSRQNIFETVGSIVGNSRTINQVEMISTIVEDESTERGTYTVPEAGRIPVRTLRTTQQSVAFFKHGSGLRMTYEFNRRASLDILTPFAARVTRELEQSKVGAAVSLILNGYTGNTNGYGAATEVNQFSYASDAGFTHTAGTIAWEGFLYWLVERAKAGAPVDTIIGNWDSWFKWQKMMATPGANMGPSTLDILAAAGVKIDVKAPNPLAAINVSFALASTAPTGKLIGITKAETLEELKEAGSNIEESEKSILNQTMTFVKTENTGFKLAWGDTRSIYDYTQAS